MAKTPRKKKIPGEKDPETIAQGNRLRLAREAAGLKYAVDGAKMLGEDEATYRQYENGTRPYWPHAKRFADAYKTSASWLLWGQESDPIFEIAEAIAQVDDKKLATDVVRGALAPLMKRA